MYWAANDANKLVTDEVNPDDKTIGRIKLVSYIAKSCN